MKYNVRNTKLLAFLTFLLLTSLVIILKRYHEERYHKKEKIARISNITLGEVSFVKVTIVIDNDPGPPLLRTPWGLSLYIKTNIAEFIFDTGPDLESLKDNLRSLNISLSDVNFIVLSHEHGDHVGGLSYIAKERRGIKLYIPKHSSAFLKNRIKSLGFKLVEVEQPTKLAEGILTTGELYGDGVYEQAIIVNVKNKGLIVITGCSHPGIENIVKYAYNLTKIPIYAVIGGFHLVGVGKDRLKNICDTFLELNVSLVFPIHCSGDTARQYFMKELGSRYGDGHVGMSIFISDEGILKERRK